MTVPATPINELDSEALAGFSPQSPAVHENRVFIEGGSTISPSKRRRSNPDWTMGPPFKQKILHMDTEQYSPRSQELKEAVHESEKIMQTTHPAGQIEEAMVSMAHAARPSLAVRRSAPHLHIEGLNPREPGLSFTGLRDLLHFVVNESLLAGGRPDFATSQRTEAGEKIEIRSRSSNGLVSAKVIDWSVDPAFTDTLLVDSRDLAKLISCILLNAIKFTNTGTITVSASLSSKANSASINVRDTGSGIPEAFLPNLFKPFSRGDSSTTQSKDGLGLGLLVAKGLARRMGGDLVCVRSSTVGPDRGTEFEIRIPINQHEGRSRSPFAPTTTRMMMTPPHNDKADESIPPAARHSNKPLQQPSPSLTDECASPSPVCSAKDISKYGGHGKTFDSKLGEKFPLTVLVAEDNRINRNVLVSMLKKLGYRDIYEACDGQEAVQIFRNTLPESNNDYLNIPPSENVGKMKPIDLVLMDLWMPDMDGYQATVRIYELIKERQMWASSSSALNFPLSGPQMSGQTSPISPTVLAVSADVTDEALGRAERVGMKGYMTKPYMLSDLERLIVGFAKNGVR